MSAESPRHGRTAGGPLTVASQPPSDRSLIDTVSGFLNDVTLSGQPGPDPRDTIQWAHFETADINEPAPEGDRETEAPLLLVLGYGSGVQVWLIPPNGEAQEVLSWRQGSVRALRILPTPAAGDSFAAERPLLALCDTAGPQPPYCSLSFVSLRRGEQVKSIKFKSPILDVLANKRSVVVSFSERFAVFDAGTLEDRLAVTTCYPCPCPLGGAGPLNPLALGDRWLAYAEKKLNATKRSSGGCEGEGVTSYTATVLHAAKSLSKGLRGLGESVASSLAGGRTLSQSPSPPNADHQQPGVVTILDIEGSSEEDIQEPEEMCDPTVAHFVAHSDAIISLKFDASGMLLVTADKRGHDFHVFRVQPHPCHPSLAAVHHLYILHRGDTTAKVQDIAISLDSRWAAVSTLRGTTHVFPISPYGGPCGVRTHTQPRVVNRLSRFHRSAGLPIHSQNARSSSPVGDGIAQGAWFPNPRLPPYPLPTTLGPLSQLRPMPAAAGIPTHTITRNSSGRQRLSSLSEETGGVPLLACARWGAAPAAPAAPAHPRSPAAHALYVMAATGHLLHYLIHPRHAAGVAKEKVCEDTPVELGVELVAQWPLSRPPAAPDAAAPLPSNNPLLHRQHYKGSAEAGVSEEERWLAQVEIVTHAGPHRRLWMGPQFVFKTYNAMLSGSSSSLLEAEAVEVEAAGAARSPPVNMPGARPLVPVLIDSGSASSLEHSPSDSFRRKSFLLEAGGKPVGDVALGDVQLKEDLAEAMRDTEQGGSLGGGADVGRRAAAVARAVDPLGTVVAPGEEETDIQETDDDPDLYTQANTDEALFRPVVRAPAALPPPSDLPVSPLPAGTTIPVENLLRTSHPLTPGDHSEPLRSEVVIPAALTCQYPDISTAVREKETLKPYSIRSSMEKDVEINTVDLTCNRQDKQYLGKEKEGPKPIEVKKHMDVPVDISVTEVKVEGGQSMTDEYTNVDKPRVSKSLQKYKSRDRRSVTPLKSEEAFKSEPSKIAEPELKVKSEPLPKFKEQLKTDIQLSSPKSTARKSYQKPSKPEENVKANAEVEQNDFLNENIVEFTVTLPATKEETKDIDESSKADKESIELVKPETFETFNRTEDQIWAMLSENIQEKVDSSIQQQTKKTMEESKSKPRKSRKNKSRLSSAETNMYSQETEEYVKYSTFTEPLTITGNLVERCEEVQQTTSSTPPIEEISNLIAIKNNSKGFIKAKSSSPETSRNVKHVKNAVDFEEICSTHSEDLNYDAETPSFFTGLEPKTVRKFPSKQHETISKADESVIDSIEGFNRPMDFDSLFNRKDKKIEADSNVVKTKDATTQDIYSDNLFSVQTNKSKKPNRKDRLKNDDFVSVENFETKEFDSTCQSKKYTSLIIDLDKELNCALETKTKVDEPEIIVVDSIMEDFPTIGSSRNIRSHKKRSVLPQAPASQSVPPVKSYSSITAFSTKLKDKQHEDLLGMDITENILEPPKPCRPSLHDKLVELCKISDIAVAECDAPGDSTTFDEDSSVFELPPLEPLDFSLDEFKLEVMRDSLLDVEDKKRESPICKINIDDILFNIKDVASKKGEDVLKHKTAKTSGSFHQDLSVVEIKSECETKSDLKGDTAEREVMEKSSDDDNASPGSSQTESDEKEEKKSTVPSSLTLPTPKSSSKKKSRQKKRK